MRSGLKPIILPGYSRSNGAIREFPDEASLVELLYECYEREFADIPALKLSMCAF